MAPLRGQPTPSFLARIAAGQVGGVILLGNDWTSPARTKTAVARVQQEACNRHGRPLLVAVDQEGGTVRRLRFAPPTLAASEMTTPATALGQAHATAAVLRDAGVGIDFAPVADVLSTTRSFLGTRSFGSDPATVARLVRSFVRGLQGGHVAATAKHFPGLGSAVASTDDRAVTITRNAPFLEARLAPFRTGTKLVMVSNASYPALDPSGSPAVFSRPIVTDLLRVRLGFDGVVVTDALDAKSVMSTPHAGARALAAGVDLLLYSKTAASEAGYATLVRDAAASATVRTELTAAVRRLDALEGWLGLTC